MSEVKRVVRNSSFIFATNLLSKILSLFLIIVLARYLGVEKYGALSFVLSFAGLFAIFGNFGVSLLLQRLVARDKKMVHVYFSNSLVLTGILNILTFFLILLVANILRYDVNLVNLLIIGAVFIVFQNFKYPFKSVYEAFERMHYVFWTRTAKIILRLGLIFVFISLKQDLFIILLTYAVVEFLMIFVDLWIYNMYIGKLSFKPNKKIWLDLLKKSIPFGIAGIFISIYDKIDITMLSKLVENPQVMIGYYSSAYELMSSLSFIAVAVSAALAPIAFRAFVNNKPKLIRIYKGTLKMFMALAIPIGVGGVILAQQIIFLIYGEEFFGAIPAFQILIWAVIFNFQMYAIGLALNSMNLEKETMKATILSVIFNVVANLILLPIYGYLAAGVTTVVSVFIYFFYCFRVTQRKLVKVNLFRILLPIVISSAVMGVVLVLLRDNVHVILSIPIGFVVYVITLYLFKGIDEDFLKTLRKILKKGR